MPALHSVDQLALDEVTVEDPELEELLEEREKRKASLAAVRAEYKASDNRAKAEIARRDELTDETALRVGRFRLAQVTSKAHAVSFETEAKKRVTIEAVDE